MGVYSGVGPGGRGGGGSGPARKQTEKKSPKKHRMRCEFEALASEVAMRIGLPKRNVGEVPVPEPGTFPPGPPKTITRQIRKLAPRGPAAKCQAASSWAGSRTVGIPPPRVVGHKVVTKRVSCEGGVTAQGIKKRGTRDPTFKRPNSLFLFLTRAWALSVAASTNKKKRSQELPISPFFVFFFPRVFRVTWAANHHLCRSSKMCH